MSPTVFRAEGMRFFFFSREESRVHVHVLGASGEAKIWVEPEVQIARNWGLDDRKLRRAVELVREREGEIREAWRGHFGG
jgi:hypothetical protein